jgi:Uncharacterised nucleotidyltransferase
MKRDAMLLVDVLRDPASTAALDADGWTALLAMARAEQLIGTLARRLSGLAVPDAVAGILDEARINAEYQRRSALWEADCARRALADYSGKIVLMKGTAYAAAGLKASEGRHIGDLDIMVAREDLPQVEAALLAAGWEWVKEDAYDDAYYRDHMHELPPLIHKERDRMIDVHHTILPLTARPRPDAAAMLAEAVELENGLYIFSDADIIIHCVAHVMADGDLAGGLRNLWDLHCLEEEFAPSGPNSLHARDQWMWGLDGRADQHHLKHAIHRAERLARFLYGSAPDHKRPRLSIVDRLFVNALTARDGWGRPTRKLVRLIFYIRSHWLRMPPLMLAKHLWMKWRKG